MRPVVVAVDGPAGSGKSSVCRAVADRMGLAYLDTGAMYRAMTWAVLESGVDPEDAAAVAALAPRVQVVSGTDPTAPGIKVAIADVSGALGKGVDVAEPIRGERVTSAVSAVSAVPSVREQLVRMQRERAQDAVERGQGIVVEGRDITTVVLRDADVKIFITADPAVRAQRRARQDEQRGETDVDVKETQEALLVRDAKDSTRAASPLTQAADALELDTTHLGLEEVIELACGLVAEAAGRA